MITMMKRWIALSALLLLTACANTKPSTAPETSSYQNSSAGYSISYPRGFAVRENDTLITDDFQIDGTAFIFPDSYAEGKTLNETKIHVGVQKDACPDSQSPKTAVTINNTQFQKFDWSGVGAGNLYQGTTYETMHGNFSCYIITLYMHSCNLGPDCSPGHAKSFDKQPLVDVFEKMLGTFKVL